MPRILPYRSKPVETKPTPESLRKARWCFVAAAALALLGVATIGLSIKTFVWGLRSRVTAVGPRTEGRLAAYLMVFAFMLFGGAIERLNAGFYHRSGFETRRGHRDS